MIKAKDLKAGDKILVNLDDDAGLKNYLPEAFEATVLNLYEDKVPCLNIKPPPNDYIEDSYGIRLSEVISIVKESPPQIVDNQHTMLLERCLDKLEKMPYGEVANLVSDIHEYLGKQELNKLSNMG